MAAATLTDRAAGGLAACFLTGIHGRGDGSRGSRLAPPISQNTRYREPEARSTSGRHRSLAQGVPPVLNRDSQAVDPRVRPQPQCCELTSAFSGEPVIKPTDSPSLRQYGHFIPVCNGVNQVLGATDQTDRSQSNGTGPASRQLQDKTGGVAPAGLSLDRATSPLRK